MKPGAVQIPSIVISCVPRIARQAISSTDVPTDQAIAKFCLFDVSGHCPFIHLVKAATSVAVEHSFENTFHVSPTPTTGLGRLRNGPINHFPIEV